MNGTLRTLNITDPFNSANTQNCSYLYDDLTRLQSANCGTIWSQTFSYDPFGNISKSGSMSFQPTYSATTNRMTSLPGFTPSYDANGNVLNDNSHIYTWDAEGRPVTVDGVGLTYDALGRMLEQNRSGAYTQIVYAPTGEKLALMNGQTLLKAFVQLPANVTAVYTSSGLAYYRHADWLGSSRFASTPSRAMYSDTAYAPFGEPYAQAGSSDLSFTGQNQDTVGGLYDFPFREYATQGRWPSPDPAGLAVADLSNPQSLNLYGYAFNNPCSFVDPLGLTPACTINVSIGGIGGRDIQSQIQRLFAQAKVGVNFNTTPQAADFTLIFVDSNLVAGTKAQAPIGAGGITPSGANYGWVYQNKVMMQLIVGGNRAADLSISLGSIGAHEIMHGLGLSDSPLEHNLMGAGVHVAPRDQTLTPAQKRQLLAACQGLRLQKDGGGGGELGFGPGGGDTLGGEWFFFQPYVCSGNECGYAVGQWIWLPFWYPRPRGRN